MKNIHVLPTDKPSRLHVDLRSTFLTPNYQIGKEINSVVDSINIYISSDEEIKEGDYYITILDNEIFKADSSCIRIMNDANKSSDTTYKNTHFKIILTTDQDLIKDGVQAIDDEFLEWFINNQSCEVVEVTYGVLKPFQSEDKGYLIHCPDNEVLEEPKQETLEEAFEKWADQQSEKGVGYYKLDVLRFGAKWQQERMYSEEDMKKAFEDGKEDIDYSEVFGFVSKLTTEEWFEQVKKK